MPEQGPLDRLVTLPVGVPERTLGWEGVRFGAKYLRQPNGPRAGQRFEFTDTQIRFMLWWYAVDDAGGWLFRKAVRQLAKGSGKSPFAALMALVELCANVRFDHFDSAVPGGCVGRPVSMPLVQIAAAAESQTENTMRMVRAFAPKGSRVVRDFGLDPGLTQYYKAGGGKLHILTSSSRAAEGAEATFVVGDEPEHWVPGNGGPEFSATLEDNLAKSGSRLLLTENAWVPGAGSVAEDTWDAWVAQEEGRGRGETRILYDARKAPPNAVMHDEPGDGQVGITEALRFVYDDCGWVDLPAIRERIWDPRATEDASRRKFFNQPTADQFAWVDPLEWSVLAQPDVLVADGEEIVLFFDGSKTKDATALVGCRMSDGHVFLVGAWEPLLDGRDVPVEAVDSAVVGAFARYKVVAFFADVQEWQGFVRVTWPDRYKDGLLVWASRHAKEPAPIAWDMRGHAWEFAEAAETCHAEIVGRQFTHDGSSVVARHVWNARNHEYKGRLSISKESPDSAKKIDAAVCVIGARMVRRQVLGSKEWQSRKPARSGKAKFF